MHRDTGDMGTHVGRIRGTGRMEDTEHTWNMSGTHRGTQGTRRTCWMLRTPTGHTKGRGDVQRSSRAEGTGVMGHKMAHARRGHRTQSGDRHGDIQDMEYCSHGTHRSHSWDV